MPGIEVGMVYSRASETERGCLMIGKVKRHSHEEYIDAILLGHVVPVSIGGESVKAIQHGDKIFFKEMHK